MTSNYCEIHCTNGTIFKTIVDTLRSEMETLSLQISTKGIHINGMDSTHVSFVDISLLPSSFSLFDIPKDAETFEVSLSLETLHKVLRSCGPNDSMKIIVKEKNDVQIGIHLKNNVRENKFNVNTLDIEHDSIGLPKLTYDANWSLAATTFKRICDELGYIDDGNISFENHPSAVNIQMTSIDCDSTIELNKEGGLEGSSTSEKPFSQSISLTKLKSYSSFAKLSKTIEIHSTPKMPIHLHFPVVMGDETVGNVRCHLAPCIED